MLNEKSKFVLRKSTIMDYQQTIEWLYRATPQFQQIGAAAYKPGLDTARELDKAFGHAHYEYPTIHVAGTNGKGSTCHTLASVLMKQGYRVGLFTSPHLVDFRERIRVNGEMISHEGVIDFIERYKALNFNIEPSFFELTTIMAFDWFAKQKVDYAVIETGLGGRLDTTNIISPILTIITNISKDHVAQLGDTLEKIASEKAGIIKHNVPIIIGNSCNEGVKQLFVDKAVLVEAPITFAQELQLFDSTQQVEGGILYKNSAIGDFIGELSGECQTENMATILAAILQLRNIGIKISDDAIRQGVGTVCKTTGLMGRWMKVAENPLIICDTGHNEGGWDYLGKTLSKYGEHLKMVIGFVNDKEVDSILNQMPREASYYFTKASVPRALEAEKVAAIAKTKGLKGEIFHDVKSALNAAKIDATPDDLIFVGGSTFVVADLLSD